MVKQSSLSKMELPVLEVQIITKYIDRKLVKDYVNLTLGPRFTLNFVESFTKPGIIYHDGFIKKYHTKHIYVICTNDVALLETREIHLEDKRFTVNRPAETARCYQDFVNKKSNFQPYVGLSSNANPYMTPTKFNACVQELIGMPNFEIFRGRPLLDESTF